MLVTHGHSDHLSPEDLARSHNQIRSLCVHGLTPTPSRATCARSHRANDEGVVSASTCLRTTPTSPTIQERRNAGYVATRRRTYLPRRRYRCDPEMGDIECDRLCSGGRQVYNGRQEAVEAVRLIEPKIVVPMHWGAIVLNTTLRHWRHACSTCAGGYSPRLVAAVAATDSASLESDTARTPREG